MDYRGSLSSFDFLDVGRNPVAVLSERAALGEVFLEHFLAQYLSFVRSVPAYLQSTRTALMGKNLDAVCAELELNIREELGQSREVRDKYEYRGAQEHLSHYSFLLLGLEEELDFRPDFGLVNASTEKFLGSMEAFMSAKDSEFACGAFYALELTAIKELSVVQKILVRVTSALDLAIGPKLSKFFEMHIDHFEVLHASRAEKAFAADGLRFETSEPFQSGFLSVVNAMEKWWQELAIDQSN